MCGIICFMYAAESQKDEALFKVYEDCLQSVRNRGPDSFSSTKQTHSNHTFHMSSSVLWLQGESMTTQPLQTERSTLLYNGDIFNEEVLSDRRGDTKYLLERLESRGDLVALQGPYAFVHLDRTKAKLYFARDIFGRRSLLVGKVGSSLIITSVAVKNDCGLIELPPLGVFSYDLTTRNFSVVPWGRFDNFTESLVKITKCLGSLKYDSQQQPIEASNEFREPREEDLQVYKTNDTLNSLLNHPKHSHNIRRLGTLIRAAVKRRVYTLPGYCRNCIVRKTNCTHSRVGVLFSGGLDCTVLALIVDEFLDKTHPIDLINVAFGDFNTPDRTTGLESWEELKALRPERTWNFLEINVTKQEVNSERENVIKHLIYPLNTILDDSLGCAIWFASRGKAEDYVSPCRVLFVGMGADELFGGYTHHRAALKKRGWSGLQQSLKQDWENISYRNLGRDDRVVADHGRQLRTPFLDEDLVEFLLNLPPWEKTYPSEELPQGLGEKILLRALAYSLGLRRASLFKKRAIQFGSRIADKKEKAHEVSPRL